LIQLKAHRPRAGKLTEFILHYTRPLTAGGSRGKLDPFEEQQRFNPLLHPHQLAHQHITQLSEMAKLAIHGRGNMNAFQLSPTKTLRQRPTVKPIGLHSLSWRFGDHRRRGDQAGIALGHNPIIQSIPCGSSLVHKGHLLIGKVLTHVVKQVLYTIRHAQGFKESVMISKCHRDASLVHVQSRKHIVVPRDKCLASHRSASLIQWLKFPPLYLLLGTRGEPRHPSYKSQEHYAVAIPFIRIGLDRGEKCIYIADDDTVGDVRQAMQSEGIDVDRAIASKALVLATKEQAYLAHGSFHPDWMFTFWKETTQLAMSEGFSALRATGETEWVLRGGRGLERWMEYESRLTHTLSESNCSALCQYNRRLFPPELILDVIRTHPMVVYGSTVCRNLYYVPANEFLGTNQTGREVERLLTNIRERERVEDDLREQLTERRRAEEELRRTGAYLAEGQRISHTGSWGWNIATGELFWSQEHFRIFGFDPESAKPSYSMFLERIHPKDRAFVEQTVDRAVREGSDLEMDYRIVLTDGSTRYLQSLGHPVIRESGDLVEFVGTVMDVTERKRAEEALREAQAELAHVTRVTTLGEL